VWSKRPTEGRAWATALVVALVVVVVGMGIYFGATRGGGGSSAQAEQLWTCPMHPSVVRPEPGTCPICGMDLVPMEEEGKKAGGIEGHGVVEISPDKQQLIGVVTTAVERRGVARTVRTVGRVEVDESRLSEVHTKVEGWVETLYANETGKVVKKGQPLLTIYSPELVATQEEYLLALRSRERTKDSPFEEVRRSGETMVGAARRRLELWDISAREVEQLERSGVVKKALTVYAPSAGYVMEKMVVEGMRVMPDMTLYRLADLSRVWVGVDVYEYEASAVREGLAATLTVTAEPGRSYRGKVAYVYPTVDPMTRTLKARLEFANPGLGLKPGMYGDVELEVPGEEVLAIPESAVIDSGTRRVVFVKEGEGTFVPREVEVGARMDGYYPVLSGLAGGEQVVSSPNFLIDSESQFEAALQAAKGGSDGKPKDSE
jgi:Cu(I)/Ag(I) efflux system membrane fusion protein